MEEGTEEAHMRNHLRVGPDVDEVEIDTMCTDLSQFHDHDHDRRFEHDPIRDRDRDHLSEGEVIDPRVRDSSAEDGVRVIAAMMITVVVGEGLRLRRGVGGIVIR